MPPLKSIHLPPHTGGFGSIFLKSQLCTKTQWPPKTTDLTGKVAIITGANTGLGFHCSRQLLSFKLAHLIIAVRSVKKGEDAASKLRSEFPKATIEVWELEMGSYESIQSFARRAAALPRLDIAILNAGLAKLEFGLNVNTGHEETIQVNYLSTMLLAILLLPILKTKSTAGRLTIVNSGTSYRATFENRNEIPLLASFDTAESFVPPDQRYACSKLLGQLFFVKLIEYIHADDVITNLVDPGLCKGSGLNQEAKGVVGVLVSMAERLLGRSLDAGASAYVDAAVVKGKESHGCFVMDWDIKP